MSRAATHTVNGDGLYDYGPPVTVGDDPDDMGTPQDNSDAVDVVNEGDSPLAPPPDADTIEEPGGSPTDESGAIPQEPVDVTTDVTDLTVMLDWDGPGTEYGSEVQWGDGEISFVGPDAEPGPPVEHTYATADTYTITVDPLSDMYPLVSTDVAVTEPAEEA